MRPPEEIATEILAAVERLLAKYRTRNARKKRR
jgi:hypothetical protein